MVITLATWVWTFKMTVLETKTTFKQYKIILPKTNMDTQNDGLERVPPLKHGNF